MAAKVEGCSKGQPSLLLDACRDIPALAREARLMGRVAGAVAVVNEQLAALKGRAEH
jgi:hypothetical protein